MELIFTRAASRTIIDLKYDNKVVQIGMIMRSAKDGQCYCYFSDSYVGNITLSSDELRLIAKEVDTFAKK